MGCYNCAFRKRFKGNGVCKECIDATINKGEFFPQWVWKVRYWLLLIGWIFLMTGIILTAICLLFCDPVRAAEREDKPVQDNAAKALPIDAADVDMLARLVYSEARGVDSHMEKAAVIWCVLNRVDAGRGTIAEVVTAPAQFAYSRSAPIKDDLRELAQDVLIRWLREKQGMTDVGRVLPQEYIYFAGRGGHNWFRMKYKGGGGYWDWSLPDPYAVEVE